MLEFRKSAFIKRIQWSNLQKSPVHGRVHCVWPNTNVGLMCKAKELQNRIEQLRKDIADLVEKRWSHADTPVKLAHKQSEIFVAASQLAEISTRRIICLTWGLIALTIALLAFAAVQTAIMFCEYHHTNSQHVQATSSPPKDEWILESYEEDKGYMFVHDGVTYHTRCFATGRPVLPSGKPDLDPSALPPNPASQQSECGDILSYLHRPVPSLSRPYPSMLLFVGPQNQRLEFVIEKAE